MRFDEVRFVIDRATGLPHCLVHHVTPAEVLQVLRSPAERSAGHDGASAVIGQTTRGRFLRVIFRDQNDGVLLVITAYDASEKTIKAFRRRKRRRL